MSYASAGEISRQIHKLANLCVENNQIDPGLYDVYHVKKGLREPNGKGVLTGLTEISTVNGNREVDLATTRKALAALGVDELGLEKLDREILDTIIRRFGGGPVGIDTIAASIGEERVTIEDAYEPFLIQSGLLYRTQKGRMVTELAYKHMGLEMPESIRQRQQELDDEGEQQSLL